MIDMRAAIYQRISQDRSGEGLGVARQEELNRAWAASRGWEVVVSFTDNDVSAFNDAKRPQFEALQQAIRDREVEAVVVYALDRLARRTRTLLSFVDLLEAHDAKLGVVNSDIDYSTTQGRLMLTLAAGIAENEVRTKGDRQRAANAQHREMGKVYSRSRTFGWSDRERQHLDPVESEMIRSAADAMLAGATLAEVTKAWNDAGVFSDRAKQNGSPFWRPGSVRDVLTRPANAGLQTFEGEVIGTGDWAPIFDITTHERLVALFSRTKVTRSASANREYLLSGILRCGKCGRHTMVGGGLRRRKPQYQCSECRLLVLTEIADAEVMAYAQERLANLTIDDVLSPDVVATSSRLSSELLGLDKERREILDTEGLSARSRAMLMARVDQREETIRASLAKVSRDSVLAAVVSRAQDWESLTMQQKRLLLDQLGVYVCEPLVKEKGRTQQRVTITPREPKHLGMMVPEWLDAADAAELAQEVGD